MAVEAKSAAVNAGQPKLKGNGAVDTSQSQMSSDNETKAQKWRRLVNARGPKAVKMIRNLSSLGNRAAYDFTDEQAGKLVAALQTEVNALKQRLEQKAKQDVPSAIV